jgi:hypothetical protein
VCRGRAWSASEIVSTAQGAIMGPQIARRGPPSGTRGETGETGQAVETMAEMLPRHFCMKSPGFHCTLPAHRLEERAGRQKTKTRGR